MFYGDVSGGLFNLLYPGHSIAAIFLKSLFLAEVR